MYALHNREIADSRTPGIFICYTSLWFTELWVIVHCLIMKACRILYENAWRTGVRNRPITDIIGLKLHINTPPSVRIGTQSHSKLLRLGSKSTNREVYTRTSRTVFAISCFQKIHKITKFVSMFYFVCKTLLVMFRFEN